MQNEVTFSAAEDQVELQGVWHAPTAQATDAAVIVLHGRAFNKDSQPSIGLCEGAAALGLTALRFDFRYVQTKTTRGFDPTVQGVRDLMGAIQFLETFGKEIKPKRLYLLGKSMGGLVSLAVATRKEYADSITGLATLGLVLHSDDGDQNQYLPNGLPGLRASMLVVQGEYDPYGSPADLKRYFKTLTVKHELQVIPGAGHSYGPIDLSDQAAGHDHNKGPQAEANMQKVIDLTLDWLKRQEAGREDLRK